MHIALQLYSVLGRVLAGDWDELGDLWRSLPAMNMLQEQLNDFCQFYFRPIIGRKSSVLRMQPLGLQ